MQQRGGEGSGRLFVIATLFKTKSYNPAANADEESCPSCPLRTMGRGIQPNPDGSRCPGKSGDGTCPFPGATCRMNKRGRNGTISWKKMCWGCSTGKPPPAPRPAPQPRAVQEPQRNSFGGVASTVSPTPIGRGNPGNRTHWTGTARQFENPASTEAIANDSHTVSARETLDMRSARCYVGMDARATFLAT